MISIRPSNAGDGDRVVEIWASAVDATHHFLSPDDRASIGAEVEQFLPQAPLVLAVDEQDRPLGFMLVENGRLEALFVDPACHGRGIGRLLVDHGLADQPNLALDVNEQNPRAVAFYRRLGFVETGRQPRDGQGRPYPLLCMVHRP